MTKPPKLERLATDLDDLTSSLDEIQTETEDPGAAGTLEDARASLERASELIDDSLDPPRE